MFQLMFHMVQCFFLFGSLWTLFKKKLFCWILGVCPLQRAAVFKQGIVVGVVFEYIFELHSWNFWFVSDFHQFLKLFWGCLTTSTILKIISSTAVAHQNCSNPFDAWLIQSLPYFILRVPDHLNHPPNNLYRHMFTTWKQLSRYFIKSSSSSSSSSFSSFLLVLLLVFFLFFFLVFFLFFFLFFSCFNHPVSSRYGWYYFEALWPPADPWK